MAAAAVADQCDPPIPPLMDRVELTLNAVERSVRAVDVRHEPAEMGPIPDPPQPDGQHEQRLVAAAQARHQDHRPAVAARHAASAKNGIDEESAELERPAGLAEMIAPPTIRWERR
jgi:hypothetical protein